jgi:hypothetical protein
MTAAGEGRDVRIEAARLRRVVAEPGGQRRHELLDRRHGLGRIQPDLIA